MTISKFWNLKELRRFRHNESPWKAGQVANFFQPKLTLSIVSNYSSLIRFHWRPSMNQFGKSRFALNSTKTWIPIIVIIGWLAIWSFIGSQRSTSNSFSSKVNEMSNSLMILITRSGCFRLKGSQFGSDKKVAPINLGTVSRPTTWESRVTQFREDRGESWGVDEVRRWFSDPQMWFAR